MVLQAQCQKDRESGWPDVGEQAHLEISRNKIEDRAFQQTPSGHMKLSYVIFAVIQAS